MHAIVSISWYLLLPVRKVLKIINQTLTKKTLIFQFWVQLKQLREHDVLEISLPTFAIKREITLFVVRAYFPLNMSMCIGMTKWTSEILCTKWFTVSCALCVVFDRSLGFKKLGRWILLSPCLFSICLSISLNFPVCFVKITVSCGTFVKLRMRNNDWPWVLTLSIHFIQHSLFVVFRLFVKEYKEFKNATVFCWQ